MTGNIFTDIFGNLFGEKKPSREDLEVEIYDLQRALEKKEEGLKSKEKENSELVKKLREEKNKNSESKKENDIAYNLAFSFYDTLIFGIETDPKDENLKVIQKLVLDEFKKLGVKTYGKVGDKFDTKYFSAVSIKNGNEKKKDGTISKIIKPCYVNENNDILRHGVVEVYQNDNNKKD